MTFEILKKKCNKYYGKIKTLTIDIRSGRDRCGFFNAYSIYPRRLTADRFRRKMMENFDDDTTGYDILCNICSKLMIFKK